MVKSINVAFEDAEIKELEEKKNKKSWHDFILEKCLDKKEVKKK